MDIVATVTNQTVRSVLMTYVHSAIVKQIDIKHYVEKIKEHEARRASFNERMEYWRAYHEQMDNLVREPERDD